MNAGRGHQAPRKAVHCLQKEVGKNIKDKKRDKTCRDRDLSREGSLKKDRRFQTPGNTLTGESVVSLGTSEDNTTGRTEYMPNGNSQQRSSADACVHH